MSLLWFFRVADRIHPMLIPGIVLLVNGSALVGAATLFPDGQIRAALAERQYFGTLTMFSALPAFLLAVMPLQGRRAREMLESLDASLTDSVAARRVRERLHRLHPLVIPGVLLGVAFGLLQNLMFVQLMYEAIDLNGADVAFVIGNCFLWGIVALLLCWRIPVSFELSRLGEAMPVDLYRLDKLKPLTRVATSDVLVVAGAMVLMPLQALDAEFRMGNYSAGIVVGAFSAIFLFLLPLWGLHRNIQRTRGERLESLRRQLDDVSRTDVAMLETLTAHIDRVRTIPVWPIDLQTATRVFGYVIIPPLAWIGA
ncbi:MAG: hypothetical protein OES38_15015, partial [Gammaproteobacteria bacterium]|nr:hypothetical protein [Gammaproteobacteria bacterium]